MGRAAAIGAAMAALVVACSDSGEETTDATAGIDAAADATVEPLCSEFQSASVLSTYPASLSGDLANAGADLAVAGCQDERAPFGVQTAGPDTVVALEDLVPGRRYAAAASGVGDLAIYVTTGCDAVRSGPRRDQCLVFADEGSTGAEIVDFVAPENGMAYFVIDRFVPGQLADSSFSLEVFPVECDVDDVAGCAAELGGCSNFRCVACADSFDCTSASTPVCDRSANTCSAGRDECNSDDGGEPSDDGP